MSVATATRIHTIGRRKKSTCRVYLSPGKGEILIKQVSQKAKPMHDYFDTQDQRHAVIAALRILGVEKDFDVLCLPKGGGKCGQAGAVRLAIARALKNYEAQLNGSAEDITTDAQLLPWHRILRDNELLTCDSRQVERKKFGLRGARKRVQYSKR